MRKRGKLRSEERTGREMKAGSDEQSEKEGGGGGSMSGERG